MGLRPKEDVGALLAPKVGTVPLADTGSTVNGTGVDRTTLGNPLSCVLVAMSGAATGTPTTQTFDAKLQDSADDASYADITGAAITQQTADNGFQGLDVDLSGARRYVRAVSTVAFTGGTSPDWPVATAIVFGGSDTLPQT